MAKFRRFVKTSFSLFASASALCLMGAPARAQAPASDGAGLDDIIVTAEKRSVNIQSVAISMKAIPGDVLTRTGTNSADAIQNLAPGLTMATMGSGFVSYTYMRGAGTNQLDPGSDPSIAFFVDEVYVAGSAGLQFDLFDIERVEVLKGPQGTLFGRNAEGGAISITTKRPSANFGGSFNLDVGKYGIVNMRGSVTGPITEDGSVRARLSGAYRRRDAFTKNLAGGKDPGNIDSFGGRAQLEWVGETAKILFTAEGIRARNGMNNQFMSTVNSSQNLTPAAAAALPPGESFYKHYYNVDGFENQNLWNASGRIEWETPIGDLTSITAYRYNRFSRLQDQDGTIAAGLALRSRERDRSFSQEVRLASRGSGPLHWLVGVYYFSGQTKTLFQPNTGNAFPTIPLQNRSISDRSTITTHSYAVFGQATYDITSQLSLTAGARYSRDHKDDKRSLVITPPVAIPIPVPPFALNPFPAYSVNPKGTWHSIDPMVALNFKVTTDILTYASFRKGYKSGGFQNVPALSATTANTPYLPEHMRSYELGLKSTWLNRRLTFNLALFLADITDQQVARAVMPLVLLVDNAGKTRAKGIDVQISARPVERLHLSADMTAQHARFRRYQSGAANYAGNAQLRSPDFAASFAAEYDFAMPNDANLTARGEYVYRSKQHFDPSNPTTRGLYQPGYGLLNARLGYGPSDGHWEVALWARNIADKHYFRNIVIAVPTGIGAPGDPRTFGGSLNIRF